MRRVVRRALDAVGIALVVLALVAAAVLCLAMFTPLQELGPKWMAVAGASMGLMTLCAVVALIGATLAVLADRRRWRLVILSVVPALILVQVTWPTTAGLVHPERATGGAGLTVLAQNLWYQNPDVGSAARILLGRGADVLVLSEFDPEADAAFSESATKDYPYQWRRTRARGAGLAVLSRVPFTGAEELGLSAAGVRMVLRPQGAPVHLFAVHTTSPRSMYSVPRWRNDLAVLNAMVLDAGPSTIVAGDLNATIGHRRYRGLIRSAGLRDAQDVGGGGFVATWPVSRVGYTQRLPFSGRFIPLMRLDHILVGRAIGVAGVELIPGVGSDHRGVEASLRLH